MNSDTQNTEDAQEMLYNKLYDLLRSDKFHEIKTSLPSFNLFRTLGIADQELRHSNMLAWLLDPAASHGFGERFLRDFLAESCDGGDRKTREYKLDFAFKTIKSVQIKRECPLKNPDNNKTRPIDILIEMEFENDNNEGAQKYIVAIENKVNSGQSGNQLSDYKAGVENAYNADEHHFLFLTKHDEEPEDSSFTPVNYKLVYKILTKLFDRHEIGDDQKLLIQHYMNLLKTDFMADEKLTETVQKLWSNSEYREVLELIANNQPDSKRDLAEALAKVMQEEGYYTHFRSGMVFFCDQDITPDPQPNSHFTSNQVPNVSHAIQLKLEDSNDSTKCKIQAGWYVVGSDSNEQVQKDIKTFRDKLKLKSNENTGGSSLAILQVDPVKLKCNEKGIIDYHATAKKIFGKVKSEWIDKSDWVNNTESNYKQNYKLINEGIQDMWSSESSEQESIY